MQSIDEMLKQQQPAIIEVTRASLDALLCPKSTNPLGHLGLWGVPKEEAEALGLELGKWIQFRVYHSDVVAEGTITELVPEKQALSEIEIKPCSGLNSFWFRWESGNNSPFSDVT